MSTPRIARKSEYSVTPIQTTGIYILTVTIDRKPPITLQSNDFLLLARLGHIITNNLMIYIKAQQLCETVSTGKIPQGYLPNDYLYPKLAYRVVYGYSSNRGFVGAHYATAEDAYNSPAIQKSIAESTAKYGQYHDYATFLEIVEQGLPYTILNFSIIHSRITVAGNVRGYAVPKLTNQGPKDVSKS